MSEETLNTVEKQQLFDEFAEKMTELNKLPPSQFVRRMEDYLASIYENGYKMGYEKGIKQSIDILSN